MPMSPTVCAAEAVAKLKLKFPESVPTADTQKFWEIMAETIITHIQTNAITSGGQTIL